MNTFKRSLALLCLFVALAMVAAPAMAACRAESALGIGDILDLNASKITRTGAKTFVVTFAVQKRHGFVCGGNGGTLPLPPGCTTDGISYKPEFSSNVASAVQTADCHTFTVTVNNVAQTNAAFRIRFEEDKRAPKRKTFVLQVNLSGGFTQPTTLPFTWSVVADPVE